MPNKKAPPFDSENDKWNEMSGSVSESEGEVNST